MNQVPESEMIQHIIDRTKKKPNSPYRNKLVSHLFDAQAYAKLMETEQWPQSRPSAGAQPITGIGPQRPAGPCTCPDGLHNPSCPIHGVA